MDKTTNRHPHLIAHLTAMLLLIGAMTSCTSGTRDEFAAITRSSSRTILIYDGTKSVKNVQFSRTQVPSVAASRRLYFDLGQSREPESRRLFEEALKSVANDVQIATSSSQICEVTTFFNRAACMSAQELNGGNIAFVVVSFVGDPTPFYREADVAHGQPDTAQQDIWFVDRGVVTATAIVFPLDGQGTKSININFRVRDPECIAAILVGVASLDSSVRDYKGYWVDFSKPISGLGRARLFLH